MPNSNRSQEIADLERNVLRALCGAVHARAVREIALRELAGHSWQDAEHRVVYEAAARIFANDPESFREQLPAQTTRMGFPDVDWAAYLDSEEAPEIDLARLIRELRKAVAESP